MLTLNINDQDIEDIFANEFNGDKNKFISFIKNSFKNFQHKKELNIKDLQTSSMDKTWNNNRNKAWDNL